MILDMQVHASVQMAAQQLKARGVPLKLIRHNDMKALDRKICELKTKHQNIWYLADGIYSMYGDSAPLDELQGLLARHAQLHLYIDDAHGMSWTGARGTGHVHSLMPKHDRVIQAVSLNKAFAAAGGALLFPNKAIEQKVRNCGSTFIFSGPIQPPLLGAALASARLHLSGGIKPYQERLAQLVAHMNRRLNEAGLPQYMENDAPLFFVPAGLPRLNYTLIHRMLSEGFYLNAATFPAVPMRRGGLRFTVTTHLNEEDIDRMVQAMAFHYPSALREEGLTCKDIARTFKIPPFELSTPKLHLASEQTDDLIVEQKRSIQQLDAKTWDERFADAGNFTHATLTDIERIFGRGPERWSFHYLTVRDKAGELLLQTFYTCARIKEDMFAPASVSQEVEARRAEDPDYLRSKSVMLGCLVTKGAHLYLDRSRPEWKRALKLLIDAMQRTVSEEGASQLMLRDFMGEEDQTLKNALFDLGLASAKLPDNHTIESLRWRDEAEYLRGLGARYRSDLRREVLRHKDAFELRTDAPDQQTLQECYALYEKVWARSFELNVDKLPFELFEAMARRPQYDVLRLYLREGPHQPPKLVAVMFSHFEGHAYNAMFVGLDHDHIQSHNVYKQILYRTVVRARARGAQRLDLAFTAKLAKRKVGARPQPAYAYIQLMEHESAAELETLPRRSA